MIRGSPAGRVQHVSGITAVTTISSCSQGLGPGLTPSHSTELEDVRRYVDIEDLDQSEVHVNSLQSHPGEGGQEEVVQRGGCSHTQSVQAPGGQPGVEQEDQVQAQQGQGEVDEDLRGIVPAKLPERRGHTV